jgi:hypothetical protein
MKRVVLSCTHSSTYDFFLPISVKIWKKRVGYEPIIFLVGSKSEWEHGHRKVVLDEIGPQVEFVERVPGIPDSNIAMSVRQHAAALPWVDGSDLIIVGDVDLLPIRKMFYHQHDPSEFSIAIYHADMYHDTYWPAYGPSMTADTWLEVMDLEIGDLRGSLLRTFKDGKIEGLISANKSNHHDSRLWVFDEQYASARIRLSRFSNSILRIRTDDTNERLCRNRWPAEVDASRFIDFHCPRPGWTEENFTKIRGVLEQVVPEELPWLDRYVDAYRRSGPSVKDPFV